MQDHKREAPRYRRASPDRHMIVASFRRVKARRAGSGGLQNLPVRRHMPSEAPGIVKAGMQAPGEIESAGHQQPPHTKRPQIGQRRSLNRLAL